MNAKEAYRKWVFEGNCPCCFPDWEYGDVSPDDVYEWEIELDAWTVYEEILSERGDDD